MGCDFLLLIDPVEGEAGLGAQVQAPVETLDGPAVDIRYSTSLSASKLPGELLTESLVSIGS